MHVDPVQDQVGESTEANTSVSVADAEPPPAEAIPSTSSVSHPPNSHAPRMESRKDLIKLAIGALGVVYGDIGTSPLYALKECVSGESSVVRNEANILGLLSLFSWSLILVVVVKYLTFIMRADNHGEGGILALLALVSDKNDPNAMKRRRRALIFFGLFGAALLYGDGMITPAISVLSAVEGLDVATTALKDWVVPLTVAILIGLFLVQRFGTAKVGAAFGPLTLVWFIAIAAIGVPWIFKNPTVLKAINPYYAVQFLVTNKLHGFLVLGSVVLCITGGEALYADMGHFGAKPIRYAWYAVAFPALLLNYYGQGALLLSRGDAVQNPFFELVPRWGLYPMVVIATLATIVASQALISGAFSLTQQAVQLGYSPRVSIVHTSSDAEGQIYVPEVNAILMVACVTLVFAFQSSTKLAAAYGIAVTGTMSITTLLFYEVVRTRWNWSAGKAMLLVIPMLTIDLAFFAANFKKIGQGGWFPIAIAAAIFTIMITWKRGRSALGAYMSAAALPIESFMVDLRETKPHRVQGTAVFMTSNPHGVPPVLLHHFKHNKVLHEKVVLLSVQTRHVPSVAERDRIELHDLGLGFFQVTASYGFAQTPNALEVLASCKRLGLRTDPADTSFFLGRETLLPTGKSGMARWRKALFGFLSRNARPATAFFRIPANRVVELGIQIEL